MADDFDPDAYLAGKRAAPAEPAFDPDAYLRSKAPPERSVLRRAVEAPLESLKESGQAIAAPFKPLTMSREEIEKKFKNRTLTGMLQQDWESAKDVGGALLGAVGAIPSAILSPAQSLISSGMAAITPGEKTSEQKYQEWMPRIGTAFMAAGRAPGPAGTGKFPMPSPIMETVKKVPAQTKEAEVGRFLESQATDPAKLRADLAAPDQEIVPGSQPTTHQLTGQLGQQERVAARTDPEMVEKFKQRQAAQNRARQEAFEGAEGTGSPAEVSQHLRNELSRENAANEAAIRAAEQQAFDAQQRLGAEYDPTVMGERMRREIEIAEAAARERERGLWAQVNPEGTLVADPTGIQAVERGIYSPARMTPTARAGVSQAEAEISNLIQNYGRYIPFQELTDLRSLVSTRMREERMARGASSPSFVRLVRLRQGIEDALVSSVSDVRPEAVARGAGAIGAQERVQAASAATRERAEQFNPLRNITRSEAGEAYKMGPSSVPGKIVQPGAKGYDTTSNYLRAVGNDAGMSTVQDELLRRLRVEVFDRAGTPQQATNRLEGFFRRYGDSLRAIEERDGGAFSQRLRSAGGAQGAVEAATVRRDTALQQQATDQLKRLTGLTEDADIARTIGGIFGKQDSVQRAADLMRRLAGNPAAEEGARRAVVQHMRNVLTGDVLVGDTPNVRAQAFQKYVRLNKPALQQILRPEQIETLELIARDLLRETRTNQTKAVGGGSDTYQMFKAGEQKQGVARSIVKKLTSPLVGKVITHWLAGTFGGPAASVALAVGEGGIEAGRAARAGRKAQKVIDIQRMIDEAMLDPAKAKEYLGKTHTYKARTPGAKAILGYEAGAAEKQRQQLSTRAQGGTVPAIGGTGGRSPGARATARARQARPGATQALQDGGEAGDGQADPTYDTQLSPGEEVAFQAWKKKFAPQDSGKDYDLRGAFKAKLRPDPVTKHWPDTFKKPSHPTFSDQSMYAKDRPDLAGRWEGDTYIPPQGRAEGGEVEQAPAPREKLGASLSSAGPLGGSPAGGGEMTGGAFKTKAKGSEPLTRQKVVDTLRSHGITDPEVLKGWTEGWPHTAESRARGGPIEDESEPDDAPQQEGLSMADWNKVRRDPGDYPRNLQRPEMRPEDVEQSEGWRGPTGRRFLQGGGGTDPTPPPTVDPTPPPTEPTADAIAGGDLIHPPLPDDQNQQQRKQQLGLIPGMFAEGGDVDDDKLPLPGQSIGLGKEPRVPLPTNKAGETLPEYIAKAWGKGAADWAMTPGRAYKEGLTPEEETNWGAGTAMNMMGTGVPMAKPGSAGMFGGKLTATRERLAAQDHAQWMLAQGYDPHVITQQTGWMRGPEGKWYEEFRDPEQLVDFSRGKAFRYSGQGQGSPREVLGITGRLGDVAEHPEYFRRYPQNADLRAELFVDPQSPTGRFHGRFNPESRTIKLVASSPHWLQSALLHEMMHPVQGIERFTPGSNPTMAGRIVGPEKIDHVAATYAADRGLQYDALPPEERISFQREAMDDAYLLMAGEVVPRNVQRRWEERTYDLPPVATEDVPRERQLVPTGQKRKPYRYGLPWGWGLSDLQLASGGSVDGGEVEHEGYDFDKDRLGPPIQLAMAVRRRGAPELELPPEITKPPRGAGFHGRGPESDIPAAGRSVTRGHNLPPEELPPQAPGLGTRTPPPTGGAGGPAAPKVTGAGPAQPTTYVGRMRALRSLPYDQAMEAARTQQHLIPLEGGGYEGAPDWVKTPEDLARLRAHLDEQARKGVLGRTWYERGQEGVREMAGPDPALQRLSAREKAMFSPKASPETNLGFAIQAHNAYEMGKPLDIAYTGQQARSYKKGREAGELSLGEKTGPYASHLNPQEETPAIPVNDSHHMENFGYTPGEVKGGAPPQRHAFMDAETLLAADRANAAKLGGHTDWTPGRIQAAAWVEAKAQQLMKDHGWDYDRAMGNAMNAYIEHFDKYTAYGTHEATPGIGTRHLPQIAGGTEAERRAFAVDPRSFWRDTTGRDLFYRSLGLWTRPTTEATGIYTRNPTKQVPNPPQEVNPAEVARPMVTPFGGTPGDRDVDVASRAALNAAEAGRAYVDVQNMGAWSMPIAKQNVGTSTSALTPRDTGKPLTLQEIEDFQRIGGKQGLPDVIDYGQGTVLTRFGPGGPSGSQLKKSTLPEDVRQAGLGEDTTRIKLASDNIDYQSLWGKKEGTGAVTRELRRHLQNPEAPNIIAKLDSNMELRRSVLAKMERDAELAAQGHAVRADVQLARKIIGEEGFAGLFRALKAGAALPSLAFVPLVQLLSQAEEVNRGE